MSRQLFEDAKKVLLSEATKLDPVGREDKDIDNDGDSDKTDSYLKKRRGAISAAIAQSKNEGVELSEEDAQRLSDILKGVSEAKSDDPDYDEDLERFKKGLPAKKRKSVDEKNDTFDKKSHQYNVTMKYAERPTVQQRMAAHDIKPGIKGYRDRIDLLKDLERTGRLKKEETDQIDEVSRETLAAYKNKASDARYRKTLPTAKLDKREAGVAMAMKKLDKKNEETELDEGSGPKEKQKTPYRDINSPESRAAASAQREKMASADKAEAGKKLLGKIKQKNEEVVSEGGIEKPIDPRLKRASFLPPAKGTYAADLAAGRYKSKRKPDAKKSETMKNEEAEQLDELGNTPGGREALLAVRGRAIANRNKDFPDHYTPRAMKAQDTVNKVNDRLSGNRTKRLAGPGNPDDTPYTLGGRDRRSGRSWSEEVEQVDERVIKGKGYDNPENMRKAPEGNVAMTSLMPGFDERSARFLARQVKGTMVKGKAQSAPQKEDVDLQEYELIEKFNVNIPEMPSYQDYVNAALKIAECKSFSELSEEDQEYIMNELEEAVATNDVSFILEAEAMSDMNDTVQRLRKAGHKVEDMGRDYKGNPFYVYIDKTNNMRRKVTYKGMQKMTQNMGRVQPEKEED